MTPPPLPPHEREWRHPSELPAPSHEPPTPGGRLLIIATAAIGLALVGVMAMRMTPGRTAQRDAFVTVSTSAVFRGASANTFGEIAGAASNSGRRFTDLLGRTLSSLVSSSDRSEISAATISPSPRQSAGVDNDGLAVVTPVGGDGFGVTTAAAVAGHTGTIEAMLPSGATVTAQLLGADNGVAVVRLPGAAADDAAALAENPSEDWTVVAFGDEIDVRQDDDGLRSLSVPEAAPVFDADGALVGLCTIGPDGVELLPVTSLPDVVSPPSPGTSEPESTVATTEPLDGSDTTVDTDPANGPATSAPANSASTIAPPSTAPVTTAASSTEPPNSSAPETSAAPSST